MFKPWLYLPAKIAHDLSPLGIEMLSLLYNEKPAQWSSFQWKGLNFSNRLGLAGGADKNAEHLRAWLRLGCGFAEVGTVTPLPQNPNEGRIIDRSISDHALWNKMGFPSHGAEDVYYNLRSFKSDHDFPVFVNIGKNRQTENSLAYVDYCYLIEKFDSFADVFVVNISSPNTKGLRDLANKENLENFLVPIMQKKAEIQSNTPILLKLSPDLESDDLKRILDISIQNNVDGFVLANTTLSRNTTKKFPLEGGVSGKPVAELAKSALRSAISHLGAEKSKKLVISVGGVMTAADVFERISMGADLVEVYTSLIFNGPGFFRKVECAANESKQNITTNI